MMKPLGDFAAAGLPMMARITITIREKDDEETGR